jgi:hypothetical protein
MIAATSFGLRKTKKTNEFINLWYDFCQSTDLLRDPIRQLEPDTFIDHRHDQSLFSLCLYNFFPDLIQTQESRLLNNAILPLRMRNGVLTDYNFKNFVSSLNNSSPLPLNLFDKINLSSSATTDSDLILLDLVTVKFKSNFSFHTSLELNPFFCISFKDIVNVNCIVVENRKDFESRISKLIIEVSLDNISYQPIYAVSYEFGGLYNDNPLVVSTGGIKFKYIKFSSIANDPIYFHLKSVYFY